MEVQTFSSLQNYSLKEAKLKLEEKKNEKIIAVLHRECEKIDKKGKPQCSADEKFWRMKQIHREYTRMEPTAKITKSIDAKSKPVETAKHGWNTKSEFQITERIKALNEQRSKMLLIGNFYSMNNKTTSEPAVLNNKLTKNKNRIEMKQEMLVKAKKLGNQYSYTFMKRSKPTMSVIAVAEVDRYHRLMARKREAEKHYRESLKSGKMLSASFNENYAEVIDELQKMMKLKNRTSVGKVSHEILNMNLKRRDKLLNDLKVPCTSQMKFHHGYDVNVYEAVDIKSLVQASSEMQGNLRCDSGADGVEELENSKVTQDTDGDSSYESFNSSTDQCNMHRNSSMIVECSNCQRSLFGDDDFESFYEVEKAFIESVKSTTDASNNLNAKSSESSTKSLVHKLRSVFNGLKVSSVVDGDYVSAIKKPPQPSSSDANLILSQENSTNNDATQSNDDDENNRTIHESCKIYPRRSTSRTSFVSLNKTSNFMNEISEKDMEARQKLRCEEADGKSNNDHGAWSDSNEVVEHVFNFGNE